MWCPLVLRMGCSVIPDGVSVVNITGHQRSIGIMDVVYMPCPSPCVNLLLAGVRLSVRCPRIKALEVVYVPCSPRSRAVLLSVVNRPNLATFGHPPASTSPSGLSFPWRGCCLHSAPAPRRPVASALALIRVMCLPVKFLIFLRPPPYARWSVRWALPVLAWSVASLASSIPVLIIHPGS